ncbi:transposase [Streptomyces sp. NPDC016566]|uniref:transposase n=1 Tax=Streptomyces sp. NPDC016566 TaxID=3364967 RepID=UPI003702B899
MPLPPDAASRVNAEHVAGATRFDGSGGTSAFTRGIGVSQFSRDCSQRVLHRAAKSAMRVHVATAPVKVGRTFPPQVRKKFWSNYPQERLNKKFRWRTDVVGIFPDEAAVLHLGTLTLAKQGDKWTEQRRCVGAASSPSACPVGRPSSEASPLGH